jgi:hypothetical protein
VFRRRPLLLPHPTFIKANKSNYLHNCRTIFFAACLLRKFTARTGLLQ